MGFGFLWVLPTPFIVAVISLLKTKSGERVGVPKGLLVGFLYIIFGFALSYFLTGSIL